MKFLWVISAIANVLAGFTLMFSILSSAATTQAAGAAIACGMAIIPYYFARAISEISRP